MMKIFVFIFLMTFSLSTKAEEQRMQWISFNPSLMPSIANGMKTATIRARHRDYHKIGPAIAKANDGTEIQIEIEEVLLTTYTWSPDAITSEILARENMRDTTEVGFLALYEALKYYYPDFKIDDPVTVVLFRKAELVE
jgi:hypothetical protein